MQGGDIMIVKRGNNAYRYKSIRESGEPKTLYQGKVSSEELRAYQQRKEEKTHYREQEEALTQLQTAVDRAMDLLHLMIRGHLLLAGHFERRSELRKLKEEHCVQQR
jgi:hypothetical protein